MTAHRIAGGIEVQHQLLRHNPGGSKNTGLRPGEGRMATTVRCLLGANVNRHANERS